MKFKHDFANIKNISDGKVVYLNQDGENEIIDLKESALIWWAKHHKESLADKILGRKSRNKYAGDKFWGMEKATLDFTRVKRK